MIGRVRRQSPVLQLAFLLGIAVAAALGHVYVRLQVIQVGYAVARETRLRHDLEDQNQKLRLELAMRRDPSVVERRARQELHMEPPDPSSIRVLRLGGSGPLAVAAPPATDGGHAKHAERP